MEDMSTYTAKFRAPLVAEFAGFKVTTAGPPTWYVLIRERLPTVLQWPDPAPNPKDP